MTTADFLAQQTVTAAVPAILAGLGELVAERSGIINVGIEGLMLAGCLAAYAGAAACNSGPAGILFAILAGMLLALVFALVTVYFRGDQIVAGTALNLLALGLTAAAGRLLLARLPLPDSATFDRFPLPALVSLPFLGPAFFGQYALCYFLGLLALCTWLLLNYSRAGLIIRALGEEPDACAAAGINVRLWRAACVLFAGACAGAAGAYLSIMRTHGFSENMTGGQGFLVLALVIFGRWRVGGLILGCLAFGLVDALQQYLRADPAFARVPEKLFTMLPYLATLLALAVLTRTRAGPQALGRPWPQSTT